MFALLFLTLLPLQVPATPADSDQILSRTRFGELSVSPDGSTLVAVVMPEGRGPTLQVHDIKGGEVHHHTLKSGQHGYFQWSPDGEMLALLRWGYRFTQVWLLDLARQDLRQLTLGSEASGVFQIFWQESSDSEVRLLALRTRGRERGVVVSPIDLLREEFDEELCLIRGIYVKEAALSPDGRALALIASRQAWSGPAGSAQDLYLIELRDGVPRPLTDGSGIAAAPVWSPDSRSVACIWQPVASLLSTAKREVLLYARHDREARVLTRHWDASVGDGIYGVNERLWFSPEGDRLLMATQAGLADHVFAILVEPGQVRRQTAGDFSYKQLAVARYKCLGVTVQSGPRTPERLFLHDFDNGTGKVLYEPNEKLGRELGTRPELLFYKSVDGLLVEGLLLYPQQGEPPFPLLVILHGGSSGRHTLRFNEAYSQVYASLGYAVFLPNTRGSAGYDVPFGSANWGDFGGREVDDVLSGVEHLKQGGLIDSERLFLTGHSYGGYLVQMVLARSRQFRAGISLAGVSDWREFFATSDLSVIAIHGLGGTPDERPEAYRRASPVQLVDQIKTPLLLVHGGADSRVPSQQSESMFQALQEAGVDSDLLLLEHEGHLLQGHSARRKVIEASHQWLRDHGAQLP